MEQRSITNEAIRKKFKNQFELVSHAISIAENMILTGRDSRVKTDNQNKAMQVIAEIVAGKDFLDPIVDRRDESAETIHHTKEEAAKPEKKRARKILAN